MDGCARARASTLLTPFRPLVARLRAPPRASLLSQASWLTATRLGGGSGSAYGNAARIAAWYNPSTRRWETPAPWDPAFIAAKHTLRLMPREVVSVRAAPAVAMR